MRVVHLLASPYFSGPAEVVVQLATAQRALGHDVVVACDSRRTDLAAEELLHPRLREAGLPGLDALALSVKSSLPELWRDVRTLRSLRADVVHCHFSHDHALARLAGRPRLVRSIHAPRSLRWSTPHAHGWTVPFPALARRLEGKPVMVLPPLVAPHFASRSRAAGQRIAMVSTFQASRRHALGLEAFALVLRRFPHATLDLFGDGVLEEELRRRAAPLGAAVTFRGYVSGAAFAQALQAVDEVWILGLGNDYAGRAAAEARACGARVVAVDEGGLAALADVVVAATSEAVAAAALSNERRAVALPTSPDVAASVVDLYRRLGAPV